MKVLKIIGIVLVVIVAIVLILGVVAPKDFNHSRSIVINAAPEVVYKNISTFEAFNKWNPWSKKDPNQKITEEGTDGTIGAKHSWKGNKQVGEGSMTIAKLEPNKAVEYDLFFADFGTHNTGYMYMEPADGGQKVTWGIKGTMPFPWNAMGLFMNMDKEIGKDFDEGLASLKALSESNSTSAATYEIKETDWAAKTALSIRQTVKFQDLGKYFGDNYPKMAEAIGKGGGKPGIPLAVFYKYDEKAMNADVAAAIPYEGKKVTAKGYAELSLPASKAYVIDYWGAYENMKPAYNAMDVKLKELGRENPDMVIEEYITDPMNEKDTMKWNTKIYFFVNNAEAKK